MQSHLKNELYNIISGKNKVGPGAIIQSAAGYLRDGAKAGPTVKGTKQIKEEEAKRLENFASQNDLWTNDIDFSSYVSEGAEQKVYLKNPKYVLKLNDAIYYNSWLDYFYNLLLHNFFFQDTAYHLMGFTKNNGVFYAIVQQVYVSAWGTTDLAHVNAFMWANGFLNTRNHDYFNPDLGIILEDLHDENVLTRNDVLYFIDTVFYLTDDFWPEK